MVVAVTNIIAIAAAQGLAAREAVLQQLRDSGAIGHSTPAPLHLDSKEAESALGELIEAGMVTETSSGRFYIAEPQEPVARPGSSFVFLLGLLIVLSVSASLIALFAF